mmetsp:Transcript_41503/g.131341  ORF Transcript_41503/g.131341 Transcript_41503/m.131341 type:complete len:208 (-) Transcript_41503:428-1051(-)
MPENHHDLVIENNHHERQQRHMSLDRDLLEGALPWRDDHHLDNGNEFPSESKCGRQEEHRRQAAAGVPFFKHSPTCHGLDHGDPCDCRQHLLKCEELIPPLHCECRPNQGCDHIENRSARVEGLLVEFDGRQEPPRILDLHTAGDGEASEVATVRDRQSVRSREVQVCFMAGDICTHIECDNLIVLITSLEVQLIAETEVVSIDDVP